MQIYIRIIIYLFMLFYGMLGIISLAALYGLTEERKEVDIVKVLSFVFIGFLSQFIGYFLLKAI
nr:MAG TPA: hypothetical protein [Caudoviricetes sp.]